MRLIDVDVLDDVVSMLNEKGRGITRNEYKVIESVLFAFPTIDAVEVVRCKGCQYKDMEICPMYRLVMAGVRKCDDFCSYGEREGE